ncbi:non-ribosomal peptide synthetase [Streptomyces cinerochromogenes]|uniref:non-ribosomal peptide synthetase n=1 Tax=Streptomyces cinerochromogenes TaxID=66422 RepID=UPI001671662C|nr:non-ribosomal peptide synthetase [Streptomyces cinerochromogenes]GGS81893.1 non-ribosomal peptide synthetase [Streptomyces cinerochromogenes]
MSAGFVELLRERAATAPHRLALEFVLGEDARLPLDHAALDRRARAVAALVQEHVSPGARVLIVHQPGPDYVSAFLGCLYAGAVAVPVYPPTGARGRERLAAVIADAGAELALADGEFLSGPGGAREEPGADGTVHWAAGDAVDPARAEDWTEHRPALDDLAFLQYTSGSTGRPKGVMVSHGNLVHNSAVIARALGLTEDSRGVSWLPPYHDMGLIGGILQPLHTGFPCTLLSPLAFMYRPARWLDELTRTRATVTAAPDFAYGEAVRRVTPEERRVLDLSALRHALVGAEPVRGATLDRFAETFESTGFRRSAFVPCYGLAEATLFVSGRARGTGDAARLRVERAALDAGRAVVAPDGPRTRELVGCGWAAGEDVMLVADPATGRPLPDGEVGEVWVSGPTVALGYWQRPRQTRDTFAARADGHPGRAFLRTGDLGFRYGDDLFLTGRDDDLMIVRGRNHYAPDLEQTAEAAHPALRPARSAAFAVDDEAGSRIVLVHEVRGRPSGDDVAGITAAVRQSVADGHGVSVDEVVLVRLGAIPRTSSGKIRRAECRTRWLAGHLPPIAASPAAPATPAAPAVRAEPTAPPASAALPSGLLRLVTAELGTSPAALDPDVPLVAQGLDSLRAMRLLAALREEHKAAVSLAALLGGLTPRELAGLPQEEQDGPTADGPPGLTAAQERMWLLDRMGAGGAYHIAGGLDLTGPLDSEVFQECLVRLLATTPVLRSVFPAGPDGLPTVEVRPADDSPRPAVVDLSGPVADPPPPAAHSPGPMADSPGHLVVAPGPHDDAGREARARELLARLAAEPFDLAAGPLVRVLLVRLGPARWMLGLVAHHIVLDGWSLGLLLRRLAEDYRRATQGGAPPRPAAGRPPAPHPAFGEADAAFWRGQIGTAQPVALPTDRPAPALPTWRGAAVPVHVDADLAGRLRALAAEHAATPFMVLMAAFGVLLGRWSGQDDMVVGTVVSGRGRAEDTAYVGLLADTVPIRVSLRPRDDGPAPAPADFATVLDRVRAACLAVHGHPGNAFHDIVRALGGRPDGSRAPVVRTLLVLQNLPVEPWEAAGVRAEPFELPSPGAQFELSVHLGERPDGSLAGHAVYAADLFDEATVAGLMDRLPSLLAALLARPATPVADLPLLTDEEARERVRAVCDGGPPALGEGIVHDLLQRVARDHPDVRAVVWDEGALTYRELMTRVRRLAARLNALGVGPDQPVAVCLPRSPGLVVAVCAVLVAGGAYVPLDPTHPPARLARQLTGTSPRVLIGTEETARRSLSALGDTATAPAVLGPDPADEPLARQEPAPRVRPAHLANILHTSGSTGEPKAVMTTHAALANRLVWVHQEYGLRPGEAVLHKTPVSFDVAGWELLAPLTTGATVVLARPEGHRDPSYLARLITRHAITTCHFVPSMLDAFLEEPLAASCASVLRRVVCSGEELTVALAERFARVLPGVRLHNLYGPAEAAIDVTAHPVPLPPDAGARLPIGRPIAGTEVYVLDAAGHLAPPLAPGELYIGGLAPARGYLGQPALTAERFVPHPFVPGARLYRTGDRGRHLPDGRLEFLGRADRQYKIRGQRVEAGEIETVLGRHPAVRAAVVAARPGPDGRPRLLAWAVAGTAPAPDPRELRAFLAERLPPGLLPDAVCLVDRLPVGPHGKLDVAALPEPSAHEVAGRPGPQARIAPRDAVERTLAGIWREVLGSEQPSVTDDFFALGGHSLLATRLAVRIRAVFGLELPVGELLGGGPLTIERLAALVQTRQLAQTDGEELDEVLGWLAELSDDQVAQLLAGEGQARQLPDTAPDTRP